MSGLYFYVSQSEGFTVSKVGNCQYTRTDRVSSETLVSIELVN